MYCNLEPWAYFLVHLFPHCVQQEKITVTVQSIPSLIYSEPAFKMHQHKRDHLRQTVTQGVSACVETPHQYQRCLLADENVSMRARGVGLELQRSSPCAEWRREF